MKNWRVLSWLLSVCIICSIVCGSVSASDILTLDDLDIDPWGELEELQEGGYLAEPDELDTDEGNEEDYGISLTSFWENTSNISVSASAPSAGAVLFAVGYGSVPDLSVTTLSNAWQAKTNSVVLAAYSVAKSRPSNVFVRWGSGVALDVVESVSYASMSTLVTISGKIDFSLKSSFSGRFEDDDTTWNDSGTLSCDSLCDSLSVYLLVNGSPVGSAIADGDTFTYQLYVSDYDGGIYSLGWRFVNETGTALDLSRSPSTYSFVRLDNVDFSFTFSDDSIAVTSETNNDGFFKSILQWLSSIKDAIVGLPSRIADLISDALRDLFIPDEDDFTELQVKYETLLEEKLGFVYQAGDWVVNFASDVLSALSDDEGYSFTFPGLAVPINGTEYVLVASQQVSLTNAFMDVIQPVLGTIISFIAVIAFLNTSRDMLIAVVSGVSYFGYLKGGGKDDS